jgi:ribosome recycling factor
MVDDALSEAEARMSGAVRTLEQDLATIRTGRASPAIVERLMVEYYGTPTPLMQLATISAPEPRLLTIRPFDASSLKDIVRAIQASDLGLTPSDDGKIIRLNIPALTEERRHELVRIVRSRVEDAKVAVRNVRRDILKTMREFERDKLLSKNELERGESRLQEVTDAHVQKLDDLGQRKEAEILEG